MAVNELEARLEKKIKFLEARLGLLGQGLNRLSSKLVSKSQVVGTVQTSMMPFDHGELDGLADPDHVETSLNLSDNTTNNTTAAKHGFCPKLSNVAAEFFDGTGSWRVPDYYTVPIYSQDAEPTIDDDSIALWADTDAGPKYYLIGRVGSVQKKVELI